MTTILAWTVGGLFWKLLIFALYLGICLVVASVVVDKSKLKDWPWIPILTLVCWFILGPLFWIFFKLAVIIIVAGLVFVFAVVCKGNPEEFKRTLSNAMAEVKRRSK